MEKKTFTEMLNGDKPVLVDFSAEWCGPCRMMKPVLEILKKEVGEALTILKVDIDRNQAVANAFNISSVPTLILFRKGKPVWRQPGVVSASFLKNIIENNLK